VRLTVPGTSAGVRVATEAFESFARAKGVSDEARRSMQVGLDELLSNAARCGGRGRPVTIALEARLADGVLELQIEDDGVPFDPAEAPLPGPAAPLDEQPVGGLGLRLVRELVDSIRYTREGGRNRVVLGKRVS
jgi:anti-sigma regulatory factor (Ser/Thr protein kinase)